MARRAFRLDGPEGRVESGTNGLSDEPRYIVGLRRCVVRG